MGRWEPNAQGRLVEAAMDLYRERGYEQTTVAEIAARAGLTERTFFRHFPDKREVLFGGSGILEDLMVAAVVEAPRSATPMEAVALALAAAGSVLQERRAFAVRRHAVIAATPNLQERELIKMASLAAALAGALHRRGVTEPAASLTAETGIAVLRVAFEQWVNGSRNRLLTRWLEESMQELQSAIVTA